MRWTAKASLFAGVAAIALTIGTSNQQFAGNGATFLSALAPQIGTTAQAQSRISIGVFFDRLAPHGRWVRHASHGYVFVPAGVGRNWRPYTEGRWVYTDRHGWYWVSEEPFGWATYHYGRWGYSRAYGWYWVPGNVWAPAWVTWRVGSGHVGWAPLAPERAGYAWGAPSSFRPPVAESWIFVETRYITAPTIVRYVEPIPRIPVLLTEATTRVDIRIEQNIVINQPIEITSLEGVVEEPLATVNLAFSDDPDAAESASGDEIVAFQAEIPEEEPQEAPAEAVDGPDGVEQPAVLEETLDEAPAEADAPVASEVTDEPEAEAAPADSEAPDADAEQPADAVEEDDGEAGEQAEPPAEETAPADEPAAEEPAAEEPAAEEPAEQPDAGEQAEPPAEETAPAEEPAAEEPAAEEPAEQPDADEQAAPPAEEAPPADEPAAEEPAPEQPDEPAQPDDDTAEPDEGQPDEQRPACPEGQQDC